MKRILSLLTASLLSIGLAQARDNRFDDRDVSHDVASFRPHAFAPIPPRALFCGDTVTSSIILTADLVCPYVTGFALNVVGAGITVDGNGHKIVAPLAAAGLFVQGANNVIRNLKINGVLAGDGILAYETPGIKITGNDVSWNGIGIVLYADKGILTGAEISRNTATNNLHFGIRTGFDAPGAIVFPLIKNNNLAGSGGYGLLVKASRFDLGSENGNSFDGSANGIYLAGAEASLHDFSLAKEKILKIGIFADSLDKLTVSNVDVSTLTPGTASQERIGMDVYRAGRFSIEGFDGSNNDVGLKFETENGVNSTGTVTASRFFSNLVSGILVVSYDTTAYGVLKFTQNCYREAPPVFRVLVSPGTFIPAGSIVDDGVNSCARDLREDSREHR